MKDLPLYIYDAQNLTPRKIQRIVRKMQAKHSIELVIIDYLQLISSDIEDKNNNGVQEISKITKQLKDMVENLDIPVIDLSQLSRAVEQRIDKRSQLADLRDFESIEQMRPNRKTLKLQKTHSLVTLKEPNAKRLTSKMPTPEVLKI